jgi:long-chain-fatty-acid--[acyl-carrier-protein] ligase
MEGEAKGVGKLFPGVEALVIDTVSLRPVTNPEGEGEICLRGPSVFEGYLNSFHNPFVEIDGKKWYRSGDLGKVDSQGNLYLTDRLKRIVKIGGEIVSLGGVEAELMDAAKEEKWYDSSESSPRFAVLAGKGEKPEIFLCTTLPLSGDEVNAALRQRGTGRLAKISRVFTLPEIPLTGTGKVNYRMLEEKTGCMHAKENSSCTL